MVDEDKSLESEVEAKDAAPKRQVRKPRTPKVAKAEPKEEAQSSEKVETKSDEDQAEPKVEKAEGDSPRVIKKGEAIEVATDKNGLATETVLQEIPLKGTEQVSHIQVAVKGTYYKK